MLGETSRRRVCLSRAMPEAPLTPPEWHRAMVGRTWRDGAPWLRIARILRFARVLRSTLGRRGWPPWGCGGVPPWRRGERASWTWAVCVATFVRISTTIDMLPPYYVQLRKNGSVCDGARPLREPVDGRRGGGGGIRGAGSRTGSARHVRDQGVAVGCGGVRGDP